MKSILHALQLTFKDSRYSLFAVLFFVLTFFVSVLFAHIATLIAFFSLGTDFSEKVYFLSAYVQSVLSMSSPFGLVMLSVLIALCAVNIAMFIYLYRYARHAFGPGQLVTTSLIGFLVSVIGIGCFSCGAFVLAYILSAFGIGSLLYILPLHGAEIVIVGMIVLIISIYLVSKKLTQISK